MAVYYGMLGIITLAGLFLSRDRDRDRKNQIKNIIFVVICFILLAGVSAVRYSTGYDYSYGYAPSYERILADPTRPFSEERFEPGYVLLEKCIAFFSKNFQMLFVVTSILMIALFMVYYYCCSPNLYCSVFLFMTLSQYYCSMNFIRQTFAGVITVLAVPFLKKRKFIPYLLLVLLASTFHKSALMMIVFYFINLIPINRYVLPVYLVITGLIYFNTERIFGFVTKYVYSSYSLTNEHMVAKFPFPYTIAMVVMFLILFLGSGVLTKKDKSNYVYVNYGFFAMFFTLMGTRHSILDRLCLYFELIFPVAIPLVAVELRKMLPSLRPSQIREAIRVARRNGDIKQANSIKKTLAAYVAVVALIFGGGLAIHQYSLINDNHGVDPYRLIFTQPFYKDYVAGLEAEKNASKEQPEPVEPITPDNI